MSDVSRPGLTRRRFIATSSVAVGAAAISRQRASGSVDAGRGRTLAFADAVFAAFRRHRIVGIGEAGVHGVQEHHDAIAALLADPRLPHVVDDVVVEFGNALYQETADRLAAGEAVEPSDVRAMWRDTTQSPQQTWDQPVFEQFFRTVRAVNWSLPQERRVRVLLGDPPIDWTRIATRDDLSAWQLQRDTHAASVLQQEVLRKGRRALVVYGAAHLLHWTPRAPVPESAFSTVSIVEQQTGEKVYVIAGLVPMAGDPGGLADRLTSYPRRVVVPTAGTWLGSFDAGRLYPLGLRGPSGQPTNAMCGVALSSLIDAGLYLGQPGELTVSRENPATYLDPAYWSQLQRRNALQGGLVDLDAYRREQPVRLTLPELPPSLDCP